MQSFLKILLIIAIIAFLLLYATLYLFLSVEGRQLTEKQLNILTKRETKIGSFSVRPPLDIKIDQLEIKDLLKVDSLYVSPSLFWLITGNIVFREIEFVRPQLILERGLNNKVASVSASEAPVKKNIVVLCSKNNKPISLGFRRIKVENGIINFIDHTVDSGSIKIKIDKIRANLVNLYKFPASFVTNLDINGSIPWQEGQEEGKIEAEGWINLFKKDMQVTLKIRDIDGVYLYPYYSVYVDLDKAGIEKAKLNFTSDIQGLNNKVTAECHLELADIVRKLVNPGESQGKAAKITDEVLDIFKATDQGKIVLDFTIHTKMDNPAFGLGNIKDAVENKLNQSRKNNGLSAEKVIALPGKLLAGVVDGAADLSKAVISGTFAVGNELKEALKASFRREK